MERALAKEREDRQGETAQISETLTERLTTGEHAQEALRQSFAQEQTAAPRRLEALLQEERDAREEGFRRVQAAGATALESLRKSAENALQLRHNALREEVDSLRKEMGVGRKTLLERQQEELQTALALMAEENDLLRREMEQRETAAEARQKEELLRLHTTLSQELQPLGDTVKNLLARESAREMTWAQEEKDLREAQENLRHEMASFQERQTDREKARDGVWAEETARREAALRRAQEEELQRVKERCDAMDQLREEDHRQAETRWNELLERISRETAFQMEAITHIREEKMGSNVEIAKSQQFQGQVLKMLKTDFLALSSESKKEVAQLKERCAHLEHRRQGEESRFSGEIAAVEHRLATVDALKSSLRNEIRERELLAGSLDTLSRQQQELLQEFQERGRRAAEEGNSLAENFSQWAGTVEKLQEHGEGVARELARQKATLEADLSALREEERGRRAEEQRQRQELATELRRSLESLEKRLDDLRVLQTTPSKGAIDWLFGEKRRE